MRRSIFVVIAGGLATIFVLALGAYVYQRPSVLRIAVVRDGIDQAIVAAAAHEFARERETIRLELVPVEGLAESSAMIDEERADLAIVRSDVALPTEGKTALVMRKDAAILLAPAGTDLHTVIDLRGRRIAILENTPGDNGADRGLIETVLAQYDIRPDAVKTIPLDLARLRMALENHDVDAVMAVGVPGLGHVADAVAAVTQSGHGAPIFIPVTEAKAIAQRSPNFESVEVLRGVFGGAQPKPEASFETLAVSKRLVARTHLDNNLVGKLTELMLAARPNLAIQHPVASRIEAPETSKRAAYSVHPGAAAFIDDEEESFFEKYSDAIYIGAMCFGLLGSVAAALASRFNRNKNEAADWILLRLLEILKASREADAKTLDALEKEADDLLATALAPKSPRAMMEVDRISALGIAFEQTRNAIADRRNNLPMAPRRGFEWRAIGE